MSRIPLPLAFSLLNALVLAVVFWILRRSWSKNEGIPPLERIIVFSAPFLLIFLGLTMMENLQPEATAGAISVVVGLFTLLLMARQIGIAQHQTQILDRQDAALRARAKLVVWGNVTYTQGVSGPSNYQQTRLRLGVVNVGDRAAQSATLQLLVPVTFSHLQMTPDFPTWFVTLGAQGRRWEVDIDRIFFVDIAVENATQVAFNHPLDIRDPISQIRWRIAYADGVSPGKGQWEALTTSPPTASA